MNETLLEFCRKNLYAAGSDQNVLWMWFRYKQGKWTQFGLFRSLWRHYVATGLHNN